MIDIVMLSYGKDSTVMLDMMLRKGRKVDHVIFCDTLWEFDDLYQYKKVYDAYLLERYGIEVITLKPKKTFEEWCYGKITKGERVGMIRGIPNASAPCYWKREAKQYPADRWAVEHYKMQEVTMHIGFAFDEDRSIDDRKYVKYNYPLKEYKMTEHDCIQYMKEYEMESKLYRDFTRLGCMHCPYQQERSWESIHRHYPKEWAKIIAIEEHLQKLEDEGEVILNKYFFMGNRTASEMAKKFSLYKQGLFDLSDEPLKNCFCRT